MERLPPWRPGKTPGFASLAMSAIDAAPATADGLLAWPNSQTVPLWATGERSAPQVPFFRRVPGASVVPLWFLRFYHLPREVVQVGRTHWICVGEQEDMRIHAGWITAWVRKESHCQLLIAHGGMAFIPGPEAHLGISASVESLSSTNQHICNKSHAALFVVAGFFLIHCPVMAD